MDIQSICWLTLTVVLFVIAIVTDEELRKELNIRTVSGMVFTLIALYWAIMWICNEWLTWCM